MDSVEFEKNRIDMEYQFTLQRYQVLYSVMYGIPLAIIGIFLSQAFTIDNFIFGSLVAYVSYMFLREKEGDMKKELRSLKHKVDGLERNLKIK